MGNRPSINVVSRRGGRRRNSLISDGNESKNTQNISFDGCYLLFEEYLQEKNLCLNPETETKV